MTGTLTMYDAVNIARLPKAAHDPGRLLLGYDDGRDTTGHAAQLRRACPLARIVHVTVTGETLSAHVADVERYDLTPAGGARWARQKIANHQHPTLYCTASSWASVRAAVAAAGIPRRAVSYLIASYDNDPTIPRGAIGKQYSTGAFDTSVVSTRWPGVLPTPLSKLTAFYARRLTHRLGGRVNPPAAADRQQLGRLAAQLQRLAELEGDNP